jgi:hypothetical protein
MIFMNFRKREIRKILQSYVMSWYWYRPPIKIT